MTVLRTLYPAIEPYRTGRLRVSPVHELYFEESGNPTGRCVVFLHGGPGSGTNARHRRFFDPARYRIILFDQRGAGRSTPSASLEDNTTWHLVEDMERLREALRVEQWQIFGGSWGSALALAYAERHPERVSAIVLRGIFMLREKEIRWFYQCGASFLFPDLWEDFVEPIPISERGDLVEAYYRILTAGSAEQRRRAATAWSVWEASTSYLVPDQAHIARVRDDVEFSRAFASIECHYFVHRGFFHPESQLLDGIQQLRRAGIPAVIVQGRYDMVCPMETSWELHRAWPEAEYQVVAAAGHSQFEDGIVHELVSATDGFANSARSEPG